MDQRRISYWRKATSELSDAERTALRAKHLRRSRRHKASEIEASLRTSYVSAEASSYVGGSETSYVGGSETSYVGGSETSYVSGHGSSKRPAKSPAKKPGKRPAKKSPRKPPARKPGKRSAKKSPRKPSAKKSGRRPVKKSAGQPAKRRNRASSAKSTLFPARTRTGGPEWEITFVNPAARRVLDSAVDLRLLTSARRLALLKRAVLGPTPASDERKLKRGTLVDAHYPLEKSTLHVTAVLVRHRIEIGLIEVTR